MTSYSTRACGMKRELKGWFSLGPEHKDIRTRRIPYLTQFSIPALIDLKKIWWTKMTSFWLIALCLCSCLCCLQFSLSKLRHKHKHKPTQEERTCAYACAYVAGLHCFYCAKKRALCADRRPLRRDYRVT